MDRGDTVGDSGPVVMMNGPGAPVPLVSDVSLDCTTRDGFGKGLKDEKSLGSDEE